MPSGTFPLFSHWVDWSGQRAALIATVGESGACRDGRLAQPGLASDERLQAAPVDRGGQDVRRDRHDQH